MARGSMIHRAAVERNTEASTDAWGRPAAPVFTALATIACRAWSKMKKQVRDDGKEVLLEDIRAIFPADADIETGDRVTVNDRLGNAVFEGPVAVQTITRRGANVRYREAMLTRHL